MPIHDTARGTDMQDLRFSVDTGGTFTDLVMALPHGGIRIYKSPSTPSDPSAAVLDVFGVAAADNECTRAELLARGALLVHGTTLSINAILTRTTARTVFLTTQGHPDVLLFREGGRPDPFDFSISYPAPYVPRALTFEVPGRIDSGGAIVEPLDEAAVRTLIETLPTGVEAIAVCLLWSIVNPAHEQRVGEMLDALVPGLPYTLSHRLNPTIREYRRASATCIDASLKPLMGDYLAKLETRLRDGGFVGELLIMTSHGGVMTAGDIAATPIRTLNSGPAMAPHAAHHYADREAPAPSVIVTDCGGTSFDVSVLRNGRISSTEEAWTGGRYVSHLTGFPSVDVASIGAGGGSIAWVDPAGLLHVGPDSAGASPGPACYGANGTRPTVTDAAVVLGYIDPERFLDGARRLFPGRAAAAVAGAVARPLGMAVVDAAGAVLSLATEHMARAIQMVAVNRGVDPRNAVLVGGGGAAGLNAIAVSRRIGCSRVIFPDAGAALSATGGLLSPLAREFRTTHITDSKTFDAAGVNARLRELDTACERFAKPFVQQGSEIEISWSVAARYAQQVWEIRVPLPAHPFVGPGELEQLVEAMHQEHTSLFGFCDRTARVDMITWQAIARCGFGERRPGPLDIAHKAAVSSSSRLAYVAAGGMREVPIHRLDALVPGVPFEGPCIVESHLTSVVVDAAATAVRSPQGCLVVTLS